MSSQREAQSKRMDEIESQIAEGYMSAGRCFTQMKQMVQSAWQAATESQGVGGKCCCENPEPKSGAAMVSNCCPVHNITPRGCDEAYIYGEAVEMLEQWNAARASKGLPCATRGSVIDGIASLFSLIECREDESQGVEPVAFLHELDMTDVESGLLPESNLSKTDDIKSVFGSERLDFAAGFGIYPTVTPLKPTGGGVPECFMRLYEHARGLSFGQDWNKGTAQGHHRKPLLDAVRDCGALLTTQQPPAPTVPDGYREALDLLATAAEAYAANQANATDPRCGIQQPVTVDEAEKLNEALDIAHAVLMGDLPSGELPAPSHLVDANKKVE